MSSLHPNSDLPPHLLRALGELFVALVTLDRQLMSGTGLAPGRDAAAGKWRRRALAASEEARRVAEACASSTVVNGTVVVMSTDGTTISMSSANILRLARSVANLTRRGTLLADPDTVAATSAGQTA